jgi:uncharacterized repeat protein (TIGR03803 family)
MAFFSGTASAQYDYRVVTSFTPPDFLGASPNGLVQGRDGAIYGTTYLGGAAGLGTIFKVGSNNVEVVFDFGNSIAGGPMGTLIQDANGRFVGTTSTGGGASGGSIFKWDTTGFDILYGFGGVAGEGIYPYAGVIQGRDGAFYGTTEYDGMNLFGTVWKLDSAGLSLLHTFTGMEDGKHPWAALVQGTDGAFYGTATEGGGTGAGTLFKVDATGFSIVHDFVLNTDDGTMPVAGVMQAADGSFYGTTFLDGIYDCGTIYKFDANGFQIVHNFSGSDGTAPAAALIQGKDGALYGTTMLGGNAGFGTVYKFDDNGLTVLHHFTGGDDGAYPKSELLQASDGSLWGTTDEGGGTDAYGTVYRLAFNSPPDECENDTKAPEFGAVLNAGPFVVGSGPQTVGPIEATDNCELDSAQCVLSANVDSSTVGTKTVTFRAVDMKGNVSTQTAEYSVIYAPVGTALGQPTRQMLAPIKTSGPNTVKTGSNLPLKFRVADANGNSMGPEPVVADFQVLQKFDGPNPVPIDEVPISTNKAGWAWDSVDQLWHFNLRTKNLTPNMTYVFRVTLVDGTFIDFQIEPR